jgi:CPA2 family monovalent cation:H+ antiporter-2
MIQHDSLIKDLALVLSVAALVLLLFRRFRLPGVLGYILAGFIIGPHLLPVPLIHNENNIHTLSQLGVIFLLFTLGLEFRLRRLREVGMAALLAGFVEIGGMFLIGNLIGRGLGWSQTESLFLGAVLAISSTTIIVKVLSELGLKKEPFTRMVYGMLIVEDLAAVLFLALLSGIASGPSLFGSHALLILGQLVVFLAVTLVLGLMLIPGFMGWVEKFKSDEVVLITVLGLCLGFCALVNALGYSIALGAFLMGGLLAESRAIGRIKALMSPLRDLFCAVFFVSVGLMLEPSALAENPGTIFLLAAALIMGKTVLCSLGSFIAGRSLSDSLRVGMSMAQIGEFSFVIAVLGVSQGVVRESLFPIAVTVSILTTSATPWFIRWSDRSAGLILRFSPQFILSSINLYYQWTERFAERSRSNAVQQILKRITMQLALFSSLIAGAFLIALFLSRVIPAVLAVPEKFVPWLQTVIWLVALLGAMPVILAALRKTRALGMILAELGISESLVGSRYQEVRNLLANIFYLLGVALLVLYGGLLSSAILPTGGLYILPIVAGLLVFFLRDSFNKIYFQGKAALSQTFSRPPADETHSRETRKTGSITRSTRVLEKSRMILLPVPEEAPVSGMRIRETELRTRTGASILAIERPQDLCVNPGPEEEMNPGDSVLLFGEPAQLAEARALFEPEKGKKKPSTKEIPITGTSQS